MSMWEFEDLTEQAVLLIGESGLEPAAKREFFANLYSQQELFDCSFTHFRQTRLLQEVGFFLRMEVEQHPAYSEHRAVFDGLVAGGRGGWLNLPGGSPDSGVYYSPGNEKDPEGMTPPGLYFDIRSELWSTACDAGLVSGLGAQPFETWPCHRLLAKLVLAAGELLPSARRSDVLKGYYGWALLALPDIVAPEARRDPALARAREDPALRAALAAPAPSDWIDERLNPRGEWAPRYEGEQAEAFQWLLGAYPEGPAGS